MISLNKAIIIGNATKDPEVRYIASGQAVANFSVATNRRYKNSQGEMQEDTQFHDVVVWGKLAEIISQIIKKGKKVYVEGRLQTSQWEGPDGNKRSRTEIVMEEFIPLSPKDMSGDSDSFSIAEDSSSEKPSAQKPTIKKEDSKKPTKPEESSDSDEIDLDDIPF